MDSHELPDKESKISVLKKFCEPHNIIDTLLHDIRKQHVSKSKQRQKPLKERKKNQTETLTPIHNGQTKNSIGNFHSRLKKEPMSSKTGHLKLVGSKTTKELSTKTF